MGDLYIRRSELLREQAKRRPEGDPRGSAADRAEVEGKNHYRESENQFRRVLDWPDIPAASDNLTALIQLARLANLRHDYQEALLFGERYLEQVRRSKG